MLVLSIHDGHNASAALIKDGIVLACVSEERINRKKFFWGWPELSIEFVVKDAGISLRDVDVITMSHLGTARYFIRKWSLLSSWEIHKPKFFLGNFINIYQAFKREMKVRQFAKENCPGAEIFFCDHHFAHAASAYYFSGSKDALVVTCDYLGDSLSHTAYDVKDGVWTKIVRGDSTESLGAFYGAVTEGLGFKPNQHEGKIVGLAAYGKQEVLIERMKNTFVSLSKDTLHFKRHHYKEMVNEVHKMLKEGYSKEDISAGTQALLEEVMVAHVKTLLDMTGHTHVCLAGGVFANVKLNQRLVEQTPLSHIFIQPAMGDEGLVLGSGLYYCALHKVLHTNNQVHDVYFGTHQSTTDMIALLKEQKRNFKILGDEPAKHVATLVSEGKIVGVCDGRMEFGPRALGARSIVADPRNSEVNAILNQRLNRSDFMPFAPSVLGEYADTLFENTAPAMHAAEFMTITFNVKKEWQEKIPAIVHVDGTARPQLVFREKNKNYYDLISHFNAITGIPLVMNTSFNMHEEPIVSSLDDALRSFDVGAVDYLFLNGSILVER